MADYFIFETIYHDPLIDIINVVSLQVITISSLIINILLFYLISRADNGIGNYRYILLTFSAQDIFFTIIHHFVYPVAESYENTFLVSGKGSLNSHLDMSIFFGTFGTSSPLITCSLCYRLMQIKRIKLPFGLFYSAMIAYTAFTAFVWFIVARYACVLDEETWAVLGSFLNGTIPSPTIHTIANADHYMIALYWTGETFDGPRWQTITGMLTICALLNLNYCVMAYCTARMRTLLSDHQSMSAERLRLQRQLLRSLMGQMVFPLVTIYAASMVAMIPPMIGFHSPLVSITNPNLCGLHPLADGIALLITVSHYRKEFIGIFRRRSHSSIIVAQNSNSVNSTRTF